MKKQVVILGLAVVLATSTGMPAFAETGSAMEQTEVHHNEGYDSEHPLSSMIDSWALRLSDDTYSLNYVCSWNVQAMLIGQMDQYFAPPVGDYVDARGNHIYTTQEEYDSARTTEQVLYNWFCNWLNSMDFQNMSEMERAQEIKKVMASASYDNEYATSARYNRNSYYTVLIDKKGVCGELTMTAISLAKALGLENTVTGFGDHAWYFIKADGYWYEGNNTYLDMSNPFTEEQYRARR
ncbi:transglutaminase domain-containing protein [Enterocloster aldenensis]|uniref:transglutaminase-like domain-containing protein n=1 Tax=Enterocloster aldenensis TaxID=358742 RepID=UPI000E4C9211|nr:transglutaminase domain-containing protein [Enterocloster aldenensis]